MNEIPTDQTPHDTTTQAASTEAAGAPSPDRLPDQLKRLGTLLTQALNAAASTEEAQALRSELRDGMGQLRTEFDGAIDSTRTTVREKSGHGAETTSDRVRAELAGALRKMNDVFGDVLERAATGVERAPSGGSATAGEAEGGHAASAPVTGEAPSRND